MGLKVGSPAEETIVQSRWLREKTKPKAKAVGKEKKGRILTHQVHSLDLMWRWWWWWWQRVDWGAGRSSSPITSCRPSNSIGKMKTDIFSANGMIGKVLHLPFLCPLSKRLPPLIAPLSEPLLVSVWGEGGHGSEGEWKILPCPSTSGKRMLTSGMRSENKYDNVWTMSGTW